MIEIANWLWQGCAVALATALMLRLLDRSSARLRCLVCWAALVAVLLLPLAALFTAATEPGAAPAATAMIVVPSAWWTSSILVIVPWTLWSAVAAGRLALALVSLRRARRRCRELPAAIEERLDEWQRVRGSGRAAHLVVSRDVRAAAVLGGTSPVIAIAPQLLDRLGTREIDRIVIHEWAHVQRRDDLLHLLELAVHVAAGWHPAVWWLRRRLDLEREMACDERVVALTGSPKQYAACLAELASLAPVRSTSPAAPGVLSSPALPRRIVRILAPAAFASRGWTLGAATACVVTLGVLTTIAGAVRLVANAAPASPAPAAQADPALETRPRGPADIRAARRENAPSNEGGEGSLAPSFGTSVQEQDAIPEAAPQRDVASAAVAARPPIVSSDLGLPLDPAPSLAREIDPAEPSESAALPIESTTALAAAASSSAGIPPRTVWGAAADAGVSVGEGSKRAAVATAGFFNRVGRRIADSF